MKEALQILIEELQKECDYLEQEMNLCIKEWDFYGAESFRKPLIYTKAKLDILKNLENPNYKLITSLKRKVKYLKNFENEDEYVRFTLDDCKEKIPEYEREIIRLESRERAFIDSDEIMTFFKLILSEEINQFSIEVDNKQRIVIQISKQEIGLRMEVKSAKEFHLNNCSSQLVELKRMGFEVNKINAIKDFTKFEESEILPMITILSRIIFDVFRFYGDQKAIIRYKKNRNIG